MRVSSTVDSLLSAAAQTEETTAKSDAFMQKEDFLMLLITQMKYQNPLDPVSNEEFAAQLAQFSSLEQLTNMNTLMEDTQASNLALNRSITNTMAASLIGKRALAQNNRFYHLEGQEDVLGFSLIDTAKDVQLTIKTQAGNIIYEEDLGSTISGLSSFTWDGIDDNGNVVADGALIFEITAYGLDGEDVSGETMTAGKITGVRYYNGIAYLIVGNVEIPMSEVMEILDEVDEVDDTAAQE